jgi:NADH dehydrogenase
MKRIVVIGGGFAGLWSAIGAARKLDEQGASNQVEVVMINPHAHHSIRVRNYEADLAATLVPLSDVLGPVGVQWIQGAVTDIDVASKQVTVSVRGRTTPLTFDKLVLASGSRLIDAPIRGLADHAFNVDTYEGAERLERRLLKMVHSHAPGSLTFVVIGSGLTGVEVASELPHRVRDLLAASGERLRACEVRVMLVERARRGVDDYLVWRHACESVDTLHSCRARCARAGAGRRNAARKRCHRRLRSRRRGACALRRRQA